MALFKYDFGGIGGLVQSGREALMKKDFEKALECFAEAAQKEPNYVVRSMHFSEGIWTYVGPTQYATGRLAEARQSLERAFITDKEDHLARLYWGLALLRDGDRTRGLAELRTGFAKPARLARLHRPQPALRALLGPRPANSIGNFENHRNRRTTRSR